MSKQDFEDDLDAVFGERGVEFAPKLREMLYELWREGRKRGASHERDVQARQITAPMKPQMSAERPKSKLDKMEEMFKDPDVMSQAFVLDSLPTNTPIQGASADETMRRVLAGEEPILKMASAPKPKEKDIRQQFMQEFFGEFSGGVETVGNLPIKTKKRKL